jgi:hypothetical protein
MVWKLLLFLSFTAANVPPSFQAWPLSVSLRFGLWSSYLYRIIVWSLRICPTVNLAPNFSISWIWSLASFSYASCIFKKKQIICMDISLNGEKEEGQSISINNLFFFSLTFSCKCNVCFLIISIKQVVKKKEKKKKAVKLVHVVWSCNKWTCKFTWQVSITKWLFRTNFNNFFDRVLRKLWIYLQIKIKF